MREFIYFLGKHFILSIVWVVIFIIVVYTFLQIRFSKIRDITCNEAVQLINRENAVIIDLRNLNDYLKGHIVNSRHLTVLDVKSQNLKDLENKKASPIIVIVNINDSAKKLAQYFLRSGFRRVYTLKGGIYSWCHENLPLIKKN